jgi:hypothetical protein
MARELGCDRLKLPQLRHNLQDHATAGLDCLAGAMDETDVSGGADGMSRGGPEAILLSACDHRW